MTPHDKALAARINEKLAGTGESVVFDNSIGHWRLVSIETGVMPRLIEHMEALATELGVLKAKAPVK